MTPQEMLTMLRQTLDDHRLSGGERKALGDVLNEAKIDSQQVGVYRHQSFDLAREALADPRASEVLDWLEDVVKVLHPIKPSTSAYRSSEAYFAPFDDLAQHALRMIQSTKRSANICVFTITDDRLTDAILTAHRRGVRVRIITDNDKSADLGSDIERLADAGIAVVVDRTPAHMHHKFAVFDESILLNGSYNWTRSASRDNNENFILTGERMLVDNFVKHFEKLWATLDE